MAESDLRGLRVAIIGGSLGGLFAANMLHRAGAEISVHERTPGELSSRGAGIATHQELLDGLARAGVRIDAGIGVRVPGRLVLARDGTIIGRYDYPQIMTGWGRLHHLLKSALPAACHFAGMELTRVEQGGQAARAIFADGRSLHADLVVAADGARSTVRAQYAPGAKPRYAGYVAWRGTVEEAQLSAAMRASTFGWLAHALPPGELAIVYPVAGAADSVEPGCRRSNLVWYRPAEEMTELRRMQTDDSGRYHEAGIPPHLVNRAAIREMHEDAERVLPPQFIEVVRGLDQTFFQPIVDFESSQLAFGRVVLIGDAAFVARPHPGMGVTKAASDAASLTDALVAAHGDIERALADYAAKRARFGRLVVAEGRRLGLVMKSSRGAAADDREIARAREPEAILREMGKPPPWP